MTDKKIVKKEGTRPCGCHVVEYSDGTTEIGPCPPCGLMEIARNLGQAGQIMAAVATRLQREHQAVQMDQVVKSAGGPRGVV